MSFTLSTGRIFSEIEIGKPHGVRGHFDFRLEFPVKFDIVENENEYDCFLAHMDGELHVAVAGGQNLFVCDLKTKNNFQPVEANRIRGKNSVTILGNLTPEGLDKIEHLRNGNGVRFTVLLQGLVLKSGKPFNVSDERPLELNQGTWTEILSQMGYQETSLLEISQNKLGKRILGRAGEHIENALRQFRRGEWRETIGNCRDAVETMRAISFDIEQDRSKPEYVDSNSKEKRVQLIRRSVWHLINLAKHSDKHSMDIKWSREDAILALTTTLSILHYDLGAPEIS